MSFSLIFSKKHSWKKCLLFSLALPPRYNDLSLKDASDWSRYRNFSQKGFSKQVLKDSQPVPVHGIAKWQGNEIRILSRDGLSERRVSLSGKSAKDYKLARESWKQRFNRNSEDVKWSHSKGRYEIDLERGLLNYFVSSRARKNLWTLRVGKGLVEESHWKKSHDWISYSQENDMLYALSWGAGKEARQSVLHRIKWPVHERILSFEYCSARKISLYTQKKRGKLRHIQFYQRAMGPPDPVFEQDLSFLQSYVPTGKKAELYRVLSKSCERQVLLGNFGVVEIQI